MSAHRIAVIIGVGECRDKPDHLVEGLEPLELILRAAQAAEADAGGGWLQRVDAVRVVNQISWPYRDLPGLVAQRLRLRRPDTYYGPVGGETPVRMLAEAALDIAQGRFEAVLLCGAEALKTMAAFHARGAKPAWADEDPQAVLPTAEQYVTPLATRYGLVNPVEVYPLYENAMRASRGQSLAEAQRDTARMWCGMSDVASRNPNAWSGKPMPVEAIVAAGEGNRMVSFPYTKFMSAQLAVNQGAAILLTYREAALAAGIAEEHLVYVGAGAGANEPADFLVRQGFTESPALRAALLRTLELNDIQAAQLSEVELYSCFPCVPKLAREVLGLAADRAISVAGGLTFFGGPGNNYMSHAIAAMTRCLRGGGERLGLLYGNGEFLTKHYAVVLGSRTLPQAAEMLAAQPPVASAIEEQYIGPCTIETYSLGYSSKGQPDRGTVIARTPHGTRVLCRVTEQQQAELDLLVSASTQAVGQAGYAYDGHDGWIHWSLRPPTTLPPPALLCERLTPHIALVSLNRPERMNAVNGAMTRLMVRTVAELERDPEVRAVILAGADAQSFCAGADLAEVAAGRAADLMAGGNGFGGLVNARRSKPWIAAVRGSALGGGTEFALACDLVVAGRSAVFGLPEVRRNLIAGAGGVYRLPRVVPPRKAMEMILTGAPVSAQEAFELHLVNRLVPDSEVVDEALRLSQIIAANAPLAVRESRNLVQAALDDTDANLSRRAIEAALRLLGSEDTREGTRAFLEKREPTWTGR